MKRNLLLLILIMLSLVVFGCAKKKVATVSETAAQEDSAVAGEATEDTKGAAEGREGLGDDFISSRDISRPGGISDAGARAAGIKDIHFDYDRYDIKKADRSTLMKLSDWLLDSKGRVLIEGHCDERGTSEYNLALGDRRAMAAKNFLISTGVPSSRIETVSQGEEKPVCEGQNESCWWKNRRAHFLISK